MGEQSAGTIVQQTDVPLVNVKAMMNILMAYAHTELRSLGVELIVSTSR